MVERNSKYGAFDHLEVRELYETDLNEDELQRDGKPYFNHSRLTKGMYARIKGFIHDPKFNGKKVKIVKYDEKKEDCD